MNIGTKIRNAREDRDLSQQEIADRIPMNQSNYSKIERDMQEPSLLQLKRIVEILQLDLYDLLSVESPYAQIQKNAAFAEEVKAAYEKIYGKK